MEAPCDHQDSCSLAPLSFLPPNAKLWDFHSFECHQAIGTKTAPQISSGRLSTVVYGHLLACPSLLLFLKSTDNNLQKIIKKQRMIQDVRYKKQAFESTGILIIPNTLSFCSVKIHPIQQISVRAQKNDNRLSPFPSLWPSILQIQDVEC